MMEWTSLEDILQDLSVAQGFMVPASLQIFSDKEPPALNIDEEEIEEESYNEPGGDGQHAGPDIKLIQEMLKMVKNKKDAENDNKSDLDPLSPEFVPQIEKKKIKRNVAISSIKAAQESVLAARRPVPKDVIPMMFKRKSEVKSESVSSSQTSLPGKQNRYIPTTLANEYYKKYLEKSELKKHYEENIWLRAERQMKEIEAEKKRRAQLTSPRQIGETESLATFASAFDKVSLPEHRHQLTRGCTVCNIASKHGFIFEEDSKIST